MKPIIMGEAKFKQRLAHIAHLFVLNEKYVFA